MHIEIHGRGPALVLIHGWAMHGGVFAPLLDALAPHFEVHLVDLPGHGLSVACDASLSLGDCAAELAAATPPALWVGWSLGGLVAMHAALAHPAQVRALAAIAASPRFVRGADWAHAVDVALFEQFGAGLRGDWRGTLERFLALEALGSSHAQTELRVLRARVFERGPPSLAALEHGLAALTGSDLRAQLATLRMPSLWIGGRRDRLVPAAALRWAALQAGAGRYLELPSGHAPFLSHADEIAAQLRVLARVG